MLPRRDRAEKAERGSTSISSSSFPTSLAQQTRGTSEEEEAKQELTPEENSKQQQQQQSHGGVASTRSRDSETVAGTGGGDVFSRSSNVAEGGDDGHGGNNNPNNHLALSARFQQQRPTALSNTEFAIAEGSGSLGNRTAAPPLPLDMPTPPPLLGGGGSSGQGDWPEFSSPIQMSQLALTRATTGFEKGAAAQPPAPRGTQSPPSLPQQQHVSRVDTTSIEGEVSSNSSSSNRSNRGSSNAPSHSQRQRQRLQPARSADSSATQPLRRPVSSGPSATLVQTPTSTLGYADWDRSGSTVSRRWESQTAAGGHDEGGGGAGTMNAAVSLEMATARSHTATVTYRDISNAFPLANASPLSSVTLVSAAGTRIHRCASHPASASSSSTPPLWAAAEKAASWRPRSQNDTLVESDGSPSHTTAPSYFLEQQWQQPTGTTALSHLGSDASQSHRHTRTYSSTLVPPSYFHPLTSHAVTPPTSELGEEQSFHSAVSSLLTPSLVSCARHPRQLSADTHDGDAGYPLGHRQPHQPGEGPPRPDSREPLPPGTTPGTAAASTAHLRVSDASLRDGAPLSITDAASPLSSRSQSTTLMDDGSTFALAKPNAALPASSSPVWTPAPASPWSSSLPRSHTLTYEDYRVNHSPSAVPLRSSSGGLMLGNSSSLVEKGETPAKENSHRNSRDAQQQDSEGAAQGGGGGLGSSIRYTRKESGQPPSKLSRFGSGYGVSEASSANSTATMRRTVVHPQGSSTGLHVRVEKEGEGEVPGMPPALPTTPPALSPPPPPSPPPPAVLSPANAFFATTTNPEEEWPSSLSSSSRASLLLPPTQQQAPHGQPQQKQAAKQGSSANDADVSDGLANTNRDTGTWYESGRTEAAAMAVGEGDDAGDVASQRDRTQGGASGDKDSSSGRDRAQRIPLSSSLAPPVSPPILRQRRGAVAAVRDNLMHWVDRRLRPRRGEQPPPPPPPHGQTPRRAEGGPETTRVDALLLYGGGGTARRRVRPRHEGTAYPPPVPAAGDGEGRRHGPPMYHHHPTAADAIREGGGLVVDERGPPLLLPPSLSLFPSGDDAGISGAAERREAEDPNEKHHRNHGHASSPPLDPSAQGGGPWTGAGTLSARDDVERHPTPPRGATTSRQELSLVSITFRKFWARRGGASSATARPLPRWQQRGNDGDGPLGVPPDASATPTAPRALSSPPKHRSPPPQTSAGPHEPARRGSSSHDSSDTSAKGSTSSTLPPSRSPAPAVGEEGATAGSRSYISISFPYFSSRRGDPTSATGPTRRSSPADDASCRSNLSPSSSHSALALSRTAAATTTTASQVGNDSFAYSVHRDSRPSRSPPLLDNLSDSAPSNHNGNDNASFFEDYLVPVDSSSTFTSGQWRQGRPPSSAAAGTASSLFEAGPAAAAPAGAATYKDVLSKRRQPGQRAPGSRAPSPRPTSLAVASALDGGVSGSFFPTQTLRSAEGSGMRHRKQGSVYTAPLSPSLSLSMSQPPPPHRHPYGSRDNNGHGGVVLVDSSFQTLQQHQQQEGRATAAAGAATAESCASLPSGSGASTRAPSPPSSRGNPVSPQPPPQAPPSSAQPSTGADDSPLFQRTVSYAGQLCPPSPPPQDHQQQQQQQQRSGNIGGSRGRGMGRDDPLSSDDYVTIHITVPCLFGTPLRFVWRHLLWTVSMVLLVLCVLLHFLLSKDCSLFDSKRGMCYLHSPPIRLAGVWTRDYTQLQTSVLDHMVTLVDEELTGWEEEAAVGMKKGVPSPAAWRAAKLQPPSFRPLVRVGSVAAGATTVKTTDGRTRGTGQERVHTFEDEFEAGAVDGGGGTGEVPESPFAHLVRRRHRMRLVPPQRSYRDDADYGGVDWLRIGDLDSEGNSSSSSSNNNNSTISATGQRDAARRRREGRRRKMEQVQTLLDEDDGHFYYLNSKDAFLFNLQAKRAKLRREQRQAQSAFARDDGGGGGGNGAEGVRQGLEGKWEGGALPKPPKSMPLRTRVAFVSAVNRTLPFSCISHASAALSHMHIHYLNFLTPYNHLGRFDKYLEFIEMEKMQDDDVLVAWDSDILFTGESPLPYLQEFIYASPRSRAEMDVAGIRTGQLAAPIIFPAEKNCMASQLFPSGKDCMAFYDGYEREMSAEARTHGFLYNSNEGGQRNPYRFVNGGTLIARVWAFRLLHKALRTFTYIRTPKYQANYWFCDQTVVSTLFVDLMRWELDQSLVQLLKLEQEVGHLLPPRAAEYLDRNGAASDDDVDSEDDDRGGDFSGHPRASTAAISKSRQAAVTEGEGGEVGQGTGTETEQNRMDESGSAKARWSGQLRNYSAVYQQLFPPEAPPPFRRRTGLSRQREQHQHQQHGSFLSSGRQGASPTADDEERSVFILKHLRRTLGELLYQPFGIPPGFIALDTSTGFSYAAGEDTHYQEDFTSTEYVANPCMRCGPRLAKDVAIAAAAAADPPAGAAEDKEDEEREGLPQHQQRERRTKMAVLLSYGQPLLSLRPLERLVGRLFPSSSSAAAGHVGQGVGGGGVDRAVYDFTPSSCSRWRERLLASLSMKEEEEEGQKEGDGDAGGDPVALSGETEEEEEERAALWPGVQSFFYRTISRPLFFLAGYRDPDANEGNHQRRHRRGGGGPAQGYGKVFEKEGAEVELQTGMRAVRENSAGAILAPPMVELLPHAPNYVIRLPYSRSRPIHEVGSDGPNAYGGRGARGQSPMSGGGGDDRPTGAVAGRNGGHFSGGGGEQDRPERHRHHRFDNEDELLLAVEELPATRSAAALQHPNPTPTATSREDDDAAAPAHGTPSGSGGGEPERTSPTDARALPRRGATLAGGGNAEMEDATRMKEERHANNHHPAPPPRPSPSHMLVSSLQELTRARQGYLRRYLRNEFYLHLVPEELYSMERSINSRAHFQPRRDSAATSSSREGSPASPFPPPRHFSASVEELYANAELATEANLLPLALYKPLRKKRNRRGKRPASSGGTGIGAGVGGVRHLFSPPPPPSGEMDESEFFDWMNGRLWQQERQQLYAERVAELARYDTASRHGRNTSSTSPPTQGDGEEENGKRRESDLRRRREAFLLLLSDPYVHHPTPTTPTRWWLLNSRLTRHPVAFHFCGGWKEYNYETYKFFFSWFLPTRHSPVAYRRNREVVEAAEFSSWSWEREVTYRLVDLCGIPF